MSSYLGFLKDPFDIGPSHRKRNAVVKRTISFPSRDGVWKAVLLLGVLRKQQAAVIQSCGGAWSRNAPNLTWTRRTSAGSHCHLLWTETTP